MDIASLDNQVKHLGFSGSMKYLLPIVVGQDLITNDDLQTCWAAINVRQAVVHDGQQDVKEADLVRYMRA